MDELDRSIVALLQEDGRMRFTEIAKTLGVTEGTVRNRVAKLLEEKAIQIIGVLDPHRMGYNAPAIIGVSIQPPLLEEAAAEIASMPEVSYLIMVAGEYDLIVEIGERISGNHINNLFFGFSDMRRKHLFFNAAQKTGGEKQRQIVRNQ